MKIEQRGFGITEIGARVTGIDVENGGLRIAFVANVAGDEALTPPLDTDDVKALIEALTAAHGLMTGETVSVGHQAVRKLVGLEDRVGDTWLPTTDGGWSVNASLADRRSREYVEREWGPVTEVWQ
jgi:hypothetical protein